MYRFQVANHEEYPDANDDSLEKRGKIASEQDACRKQCQLEKHKINGGEFPPLCRHVIDESFHNEPL